MTAFTVLAGDFTSGRLGRKKLVLKRKLTLGSFLRTLSAWEKVPVREIESLQLATEESTKRFGAAAAAGLVGGVLLGGAGLVAGAMAGGNKNTVTFELRRADGRGSWGSATPAPSSGCGPRRSDLAIPLAPGAARSEVGTVTLAALVEPRVE